MNLRANEEHSFRNLAPLRGIKNENKKEFNENFDQENSNESKKFFGKKNLDKTEDRKREISNHHEEYIRGT